MKNNYKTQGEQTIVFINRPDVFCKKKVHNCARLFAEFCHPIYLTYLALDNAFESL